MTEEKITFEEEKAKEVKKDKENSAPEISEKVAEFEELPKNTKVVDKDSSLDSKDAEDLLEDVVSGRRYFEIPGYGKVYLRPATVEETQEASLEYSKMFNKAIMEGIPVQDELEKLLISKGILEDEDAYDSAINKKRRELLQKEELLKKQPKSKAKDKKVIKLAKEVADLRNEIFSDQFKRRNLLSNSAEAKADEIRTAFLISKTAVNADTDEPVWNSFEEYLNETDLVKLSKINFEYLTFSYGLSSNYMYEFPEVSILEGVPIEES